MSNENQIITDFSVTKRLGEASTTFSITFATPLAPDEFRSGEVFEFVVLDPRLPDGYTKFRGVVLKVKRNDKDNNRIYGLEGLDKGRLLVKQPFNWDCALADGEEYTVEEMLVLIFEDTGIELGRGQSVLGEI